MSLQHNIQDGVKRVGKHYDNECYIEIPAILLANGQVDELASEKALDKIHYEEVTPYIIKETTVHPYIDAVDVDEI